MRIDTTYATVAFNYLSEDGSKHPVATLEELEYPKYFTLETEIDDGEPPDPVSTRDAAGSSDRVTIPDQPPVLKEGHIVVMENQRGVSYEELFGPYLVGAKYFMITDPYIRLYFQARNLMELLEVIVRQKAEVEEIVVSLVTVEDEFKGDQQRDWLNQIQSSMLTVGVKFAYSFDNSGSQYARHIVTDTGWKISLDRGLDIFQQYDINYSFKLANRMQKQRACKSFEVTYIRTRPHS